MKYSINFFDNKALLISENGVEYKLYNLHVHSKLFNKLINKDWVEKIINQINKQNISVLKYNFENTRPFRVVIKIFEKLKEGAKNGKGK